MLYILYGADTSRSLQKLNEIIAEFCKKSGNDLAVYRFDAEEDDLLAINAALEAGSLFHKKKLAVIQHAFRSDKFKSLNLEKFKDSSDTLIVLREWEVDAAGLKHLLEIKPRCTKIQEFRVPSKRDSDISIFQLGDVFFTSRKEAIRRLFELLAVGHDDMQVFSYLANHCRTLFMVKSYLEARQSVPPSAGIHPFVIKKATAIVRELSLGELQSLFQRFFEEDYRIKTGQAKPKEALFRILLGKV